MRWQAVEKEFFLILGAVVAVGEVVLGSSLLPDGPLKTVGQIVLPLVGALVARAKTQFVKSP